MKAIVIYQSKYGSAKRYAEWIAGELDADLAPLKGFSPARLAEYDTIVFGGGIYAGGINGFSFVKKNYPGYRGKRWFVYAVGYAPVQAESSAALRKQNFSEELQGIPCFHLRGGMDFSALHFADRLMMSAFRRILLKKPEAERTADDLGMLESFSRSCDWCDKSTLAPMLEAIRQSN